MKTRHTIAALLMGVACPGIAVGLETVRVDATSGAPRLVVDGRPVRARMFWGAPGTRPLRIGTDGRLVTFEFSATEDEPAGATMHFRFGHMAGDVTIDDIRVTAVEDQRDVFPTCNFEQGSDSFQRDWTVWPPGDKNTVAKVEVKAGVGQRGTGGLSISLTDPPNGQWPDFHIYHHPNLSLRRGARYRVSFWARAEPARTLAVAFYRPGRVFTFLGGPPGCFESQIKMAAAVGVNFVSFPLHMPWPRPGSVIDWSTTDRQIETVLNANPHALLLPRIGMGAPRWWQDSHPNDVMVWDQGPQKHRDVAVASPAYRQDAAARLRALIEHVESKFGSHVAGYHPCGQNTGEWFYQETWGAALNGYSPASRDAWRRWLADRYPSDAALRTAWGNPRVTLPGAEIPSPAARRAHPAGALRDPVAERSLIDFAAFQQQMMAECVETLAHAVRQATRGRKLVVFFYGYVFEFGAIRNGPATAGHYALERILRCPDIDVLCSPISYFDRGWGESGPAMTAAESVALAGKMWLYEDDTRTYIASGKFPGWQSGVDTLDATQKLLIRNTGQCALRNFGTWWMDLGSSGWFDDPRLWDQMAALAPLDEQLLAHPRPFRPEIAAVVDEESMLRVAAGGDIVTRPGVYEVRRALGRLGAPYGQYLLSDVLAGRVKAKMYVLLNAWSLTAEQRRKLLGATRGALTVWCYAPGYHDGYRTSLRAMSELTGFSCRMVSVSKAQAQPTDAGRRFGLRAPVGVPKEIAPLFAVADAAKDEIFATYPDGCSPALALRQSDRGWSLFVGSPGLTAELLRQAARQAGVHLFAHVDCNVYANGPYLLLHASQDGPLIVDTGGQDVVRDLLARKSIGPGPKITLPMKKGDSRLLQIRSP